MKVLSSSEIAGLAPGVPSDKAEPIQLAVQAGSEVYRVIHGIKQVTPSRFGTNEDDDYTGWVWLAGKRTPVETAYWGGAVIWRLAESRYCECDQGEGYGRASDGSLYCARCGKRI